MLEFKLIYGLDGYDKVKKIRNEVFINEQGFCYDYDEKDDTACHIAGWDGDRLIAAARLYKISDKTYAIGRIAVDKEYRGQYIGDTLMRALEDKAVREGAAYIELSAQKTVQGFYEKEGYEPVGGEYLEEGCPHIKMTKDLSKIRGCGGGCGK